jgi:hypothetical protein
VPTSLISSSQFDIIKTMTNLSNSNTQQTSADISIECPPALLNIFQTALKQLPERPTHQDFNRIGQAAAESILEIKPSTYALDEKYRADQPVNALVPKSLMTLMQISGVWGNDLERVRDLMQYVRNSLSFLGAKVVLEMSQTRGTSKNNNNIDTWTLRSVNATATSESLLEGGHAVAVLGSASFPLTSSGIRVA